MENNHNVNPKPPRDGVGRKQLRREAAFSVQEGHDPHGEADENISSVHRKSGCGDYAD